MPKIPHWGMVDCNASTHTLWLRSRQAEGAELLVALTHMRVPNDLRLGAEVPEFDLILGGHDHHHEVQQLDSGALYVKSGTDFRCVRRLWLVGGCWMACSGMQCRAEAARAVGG
jgi:2',3'-cyclic-nucleotide 2'-phosphodiesterase (5'-nucleotidase family)